MVRSTDRSTSGVLSDEKTFTVDEPRAGVLISVVVEDKGAFLDYLICLAGRIGTP